MIYQQPLNLQYYKTGEIKMRAGTFKLQENWKINTIDLTTGKVLTTEEKCNTIVNGGKEIIAKLLNNVSSDYFRNIAIGTGTTAATATDSALETQYATELADLSYEASYKARFYKLFTFGSGASADITEAGIFNSGTVMLARTTFAAKSISETIGLEVEALITVASA
jgi:hypothetical protein